MAKNPRFQSVEINQGAAGTTELVAAPGEGRRICVVSYLVVLDGGGTFGFSGCSGDIPADDKSGASFAGSDKGPAFVCAPGEALSIVTTVGAAQGHLAYCVL